MPRIDDGLQRAFQWLGHQTSTYESLELLADEAFFYYMLLNRQKARDTEASTAWQKAISERLGAAQKIHVQWGTPVASPQDRMLLCQYIDSALMLASLMYKYQA